MDSRGSDTRRAKILINNAYRVYYFFFGARLYTYVEGSRQPVLGAPLNCVYLFMKTCATPQVFVRAQLFFLSLSFLPVPLSVY